MQIWNQQDFLETKEKCLVASTVPYSSCVPREVFRNLQFSLPLRCLEGLLNRAGQVLSLEFLVQCTGRWEEGLRMCLWNRFPRLGDHMWKTHCSRTMVFNAGCSQKSFLKIHCSSATSMNGIKISGAKPSDVYFFKVSHKNLT